MDWDELKPKPAKGITLGEPLDSLSVGELEARIAALEAEIERVKDNLAAQEGARSRGRGRVQALKVAGPPRRNARPDGRDR